MPSVDLIIEILKSKALPLEVEHDTQAAIAQLLVDHEITFEREKRLSRKDRIDFLIDGGIGIEVKLKGAGTGIFRQCQRYCESTEVSSLVLVTRKTMGFPRALNGKPCHYVSLGKAWL